MVDTFVGEEPQQVGCNGISGRLLTNKVLQWVKGLADHLFGAWIV